MLNNISYLWQFVIFAVIVLFLAAWPPTSKFAVALGAAVLLSQLLVMNKNNGGKGL